MAASWECPPLPMISLSLKESSKTSFTKLKPLIASQYDENPESFSNEIRQLEQLREASLKPSRDHAGCNMLRRYYAQLHLLKARFPQETVGPLPFNFSWKDAHTGTEIHQTGLDVELAPILYNIGALHSQVGGKDSRHSEQDMKEALTHYQCSAGAFAYLIDNIGGVGYTDLSPQLLETYKNLMLGQAQECIVEKSLKGLSKVKNLNISKISMKVAQYYQSVVMVLESDVGVSITKKHKDWVRLLTLKISYYTSIAHLYQSNAMEEQANYGYMIAYQQLALEKIKSIGKVPRGTAEVVKDAIKNLTEFLSLKLQESLKQNEQVYHELVPSLETLDPAQGFELVKPFVFQPVDPKSTGTDIFAKLIPMRAYEAASLFSEEQAKILRSIVSSVEQKNEELSTFMTSLNISELNVPTDNPTLPADIMTLHRQFQSRGGTIRDTQAKINELMSLSQKVEEQLSEVLQKREEEITDEKEFQERHGARPESQVCASLWKELDSLWKYHKQANKSNTDLSALFSQHSPNLLLLAGLTNPLMAAIPTLTSAPEDSDRERIRMLLSKVDEMKEQRHVLVTQLRDQISNTDIIHAMIGENSNTQAGVIEEHLQKPKEMAEIIRHNLIAQDNILKALTEANAKQVKMRQALKEVQKRREEWCVNLAKSAGNFTFLQSKISEGLGFYTKLAENVNRLYKRTMEICNTRRKERQNVDRRSPIPVRANSRSPSPPPPPTNVNKSDAKSEVTEPHPKVELTEGGKEENDMTQIVLEIKKTQEEQMKSLDDDTTLLLDEPVVNNSIPLLIPQPLVTSNSGILPATTSILTPTVRPQPVATELPQPLIASNSGILPATTSILTPTVRPQPVTTELPQPLVTNTTTTVANSDTARVDIPVVVGPVRPNKPVHLQGEPKVSTEITSTGGLTPVSMAGGLTPVSMAGGLTPVSMAGGLTPVSMAGGLTPVSMARGLPPVSIDHGNTDILPTPPFQAVPDNTSTLLPSTSEPIHLPHEPNDSAAVPAMDPPISTVGCIPINTMGPITTPINTMGPITTPISTMGPVTTPISTMGPITTPVNTMGPITTPINTMGPITTPINTMGPITTPISTMGPITTPINTMGPITTPINTMGPITTPISTMGPITTPVNTMGSITTPINTMGPITTPISTMGPITTPINTMGPITTPISTMGPITTPINTMGPIHSMDAVHESIVPIPNETSFTNTQLSSIEQSTGFSNTTNYLSLDNKTYNGTTILPINNYDTNRPLTILPPPPSLSISTPTMAPLTKQDSSTHLEDLLIRQQETIQSQTKQIEQQKQQIQQQLQQLDEQRKELEHFRLQQQLQEKDKMASSNNQSMLVDLLKQQQGLFSQQQAQVDKLNQDAEVKRKQHSEVEMKLRDALAQEQLQTQGLHSQIAQQSKDVQHLQQQIQMCNQQIQSLQVQGQQYLSQIQERDKVLASYREEHKQIVDNMEQQCRQRVQQITQQMQELQARSRGEHYKYIPSNLPNPMQPTMRPGWPRPHPPSGQFNNQPSPTSNQPLPSTTPRPPTAQSIPQSGVPKPSNHPGATPNQPLPEMTPNNQPPTHNDQPPAPPGITPTNQPAGMTPNNQPPSGMSPINQPPSGMSPINQPPSGMTPINQPPSGMTPINQPPSGMTPNNQPYPGVTPNNQPPPGRTPTNQPPPGMTPNNQPPPGRTSNNQPPPGRTPTNQPPPGRTSNNQPPPGMTPNNQPPPGMTPTNQPPSGMTPNNQPPGNQSGGQRLSTPSTGGPPLTQTKTPPSQTSSGHPSHTVPPSQVPSGNQLGLQHHPIINQRPSSSTPHYNVGPQQQLYPTAAGQIPAQFRQQQTPTSGGQFRSPQPYSQWPQYQTPVEYSNIRPSTSNTTGHQGQFASGSSPRQLNNRFMTPSPSGPNYGPPR